MKLKQIWSKINENHLVSFEGELYEKKDFDLVEKDLSNLVRCEEVYFLGYSHSNGIIEQPYHVKRYTVKTDKRMFIDVKI